MLEQLRRRSARSGLDVVMVNVWESLNAAAEARHFADVWGLAGTILLDETGEYADRLGIRGVPCTVAVDSGGIVCAVGATTPDELHRTADDLLAGGIGQQSRETHRLDSTPRASEGRRTIYRRPD